MTDDVWSGLYGNAAGDWLMITGRCGHQAPGRIPTAIPSSAGPGSTSVLDLGDPNDCLRQIRNWMQETMPWVWSVGKDRPVQQIIANNMRVAQTAVSAWLRDANRLRPETLSEDAARWLVRMAWQSLQYRIDQRMEEIAS